MHIDREDSKALIPRALQGRDEGEEICEGNWKEQSVAADLSARPPKQTSTEVIREK